MRFGTKTVYERRFQYNNRSCSFPSMRHFSSICNLPFDRLERQIGRKEKGFYCGIFPSSSSPIKLQTQQLQIFTNLASLFLTHPYPKLLRFINNLTRFPHPFMSRRLCGTVSGKLDPIAVSEKMLHQFFRNIFVLQTVK